jgi:hypothetical protein
MDKQSLLANPFALMLHPAEVFDAVKGSAPLDELARHVFRPLDSRFRVSSEYVASDQDEDAYDDALPGSPEDHAVPPEPDPLSGAARLT